MPLPYIATLSQTLRELLPAQDFCFRGDNYIHKKVRVVCLVHNMPTGPPLHPYQRRWLGEANLLCILHLWGVQLRLAYSWARPAVLTVGKGRGGMFFCFFTFIHFPLSPLSLSFISCAISSISLLLFSGR